MYRWTYRIVVIFFGFFLLVNFELFANTEEDHTEQVAGDQTAGHNPEEQGEEEFDPGDFIFDHIKDSHEWHITEINHKPVSIPLPVILYSKTKGLNVFMSGRFEHGHATYRGFRLETSGENKGKITDEDGTMPLDLSITKNVAAMFFSMILLFLIFISAARIYKKNPVSKPKGIQSLIEPVVLFVRDDIAKSSIGPKYERFLPYLLTVFFFILINNLLGLIPIPPAGANLTGNIAVTFVLAAFTLFVTNFSGNRNYWTHIFNTPGVPFWLKLPLPIMPILEAIGIFTKPFVLMVRLFANISAGHIIALGFFSIIFIFAKMSSSMAYGISVISVLFNVFMVFVELLVAFIQAYVFTFLSALYIGMAVEEHNHGHD
ncbi:MAG: F0F1 ATP synthase subunit A [Bacteroidales bacterium]|nr:F0F1 ATP synthase subunit A [Bacteroidales bacterium]